MSIYKELLNVYDNYLTNSSDTILGFCNFKTTIEIVIDLDGNFVTANTLSKEDNQTPTPTTIDSASRSGDAKFPHIFNDTLEYMCGVCMFKDNASENKTFDTLSNIALEKHKLYKNLLNQFITSAYCHPYVIALNKYIIKNTMIDDLINNNLIEFKEFRGGSAITHTSIVRIMINDSGRLIKPWEDKDFCECAYKFAESTSTMQNNICYITGKMSTPTYKHNKGILYPGNGAKLISTEYLDQHKKLLGRFTNTNIPISAEISLKIHNALTWLIKNYSVYSNENQKVSIWSSCLADVPNIMNAFDKLFDDIEEDNDTINTMPKYNEILRRKIFGHKNNSMPNESITLLIADAASPGRMNISKYSELSTSEFYSNIEKWHCEIAWMRRFGEKKEITSFSLYDILNYAFGREIDVKDKSNKNGESNKKVECDNTAIMNQYMPKLIECVTEGRKIPIAIVNSIYNKVSNPQSYKYGENCYGHKDCIEVACGVIRKYLNDYEGRDVSMAYDENNTNRSYLYGCLLAIADKAEFDTYGDGDKYKRETNARRYWKTFSSRPYTTWTRIRESMNPYLRKLGAYRVRYEKWMNEIVAKMDTNAFTNDTKLSGEYILGYSQFTEYMYNYKNTKSNENNENSKED